MAACAVQYFHHSYERPPAPEWAYNVVACFHLDEMEVDAEQLDIDLGECSAKDNGVVRVFHCRDGSDFAVFWDEETCKAVVGENLRHVNEDGDEA